MHLTISDAACRLPQEGSGLKSVHVSPEQAIRGSSFRAPLQGLNALAPSAAANFSTRVAAAAGGAPPADGSYPVSVSLGPSTAPAPGGYVISATKQNATSIKGPQVTDQVQTLPGTLCSIMRPLRAACPNLFKLGSAWCLSTGPRD